MTSKSTLFSSPVKSTLGLALGWLYVTERETERNKKRKQPQTLWGNLKQLDLSCKNNQMRAGGTISFSRGSSLT